MNVPGLPPPRIGPPLQVTAPLLVMTAVSPAPGTVFGLQFAAVFQPPLRTLVQVMVAAGLGARGANRSARATRKSRFRWFELAFIEFFRPPVIGDLVLKPAGKEL